MMTQSEAYRAVKDKIQAMADVIDFHEAVGECEEAGGTDAWIQRVMDYVEDLTVRACYAVHTQVGAARHMSMNALRTNYQAELEELTAKGTERKS